VEKKEKNWHPTAQFIWNKAIPRPIKNMPGSQESQQARNLTQGAKRNDHNLGGGGGVVISLKSMLQTLEKTNPSPGMGKSKRAMTSLVQRGEQRNKGRWAVRTLQGRNVAGTGNPENHPQKRKVHRSSARCGFY